jgi:hypothetical protein
MNLTSINSGVWVLDHKDLFASIKRETSKRWRVLAVGVIDGRTIRASTTAPTLNAAKEQLSKIVEGQ